MGFKAREIPVAREPRVRGRQVPRNLLPICVFYTIHEIGRSEGWCLCDGSPDPQLFNQKTMCGQHVTLPGRYEHRYPTCPECVVLAGTGKVMPADYPQDLREFLPHD